MKKRQSTKAYTLLILLTVLAIGGLLTARVARERAVPTVETAVVTRRDVKETVLCTGTVGAADGVQVYVNVPCVAGEIAVEVGDRVEAGDVLLTVDRTSTLALAVSTGMTGVSEEAAALLPDAVTAPCAGVVSAVAAKTGDTLNTTAPCIVLSENGNVVINVVVRESVLPSIDVGQEVTVSGVAFDRATYRGHITAIAATARTRVSGTATETVVDAVVTLDEGEADASLLIGLSAKVRVTVAVRTDVLLLPYDCITQNEAGETVVYRLDGDTATACVVKTGKELTAGVEILGGLSEGDVLVITPETLSGEVLRVKTEATA